MDSVNLLEDIISGKVRPLEGEADRNIQFIRNVLSLNSEEEKLDPETETACRDILRRAENIS